MGSGVMPRELLVCSLGERLFALDLDVVIQIIGYQAPIIPPQMRSYIEGLIEFRSEFIPLMNLGKRLHLEGAPVSNKSVVVIVRLKGKNIGLVVDAVVRVQPQDMDAGKEPPPKLQGVRAEFLSGVFNYNGRPLLWIKGESLIALQDGNAIF